MTRRDSSRDRRVRRTRDALRTALAALIEEKGYAAVSVSDILVRADVARSTFYQHYRGKEDLFLSRIAEFRGLFSERSAGADGASERALAFSRAMFEHGRDQRPAIRAALRSGGGDPAMAAVRGMILESVRGELAAALPGAEGAAQAEFAAHFVVGAFLEVFAWWIAQRAPADVQQADRLFRALAAPGLAALMGMPRSRQSLR